MLMTDFRPSPELYPFESRRFDGPQGRMHYLDEGQGRPILLVHGNPTWSFLYRKMIRYLATSGFRCRPRSVRLRAVGPSRWFWVHGTRTGRCAAGFRSRARAPGTGRHGPGLGRTHCYRRLGAETSRVAAGEELAVTMRVGGNRHEPGLRHRLTSGFHWKPTKRWPQCGAVILPSAFNLIAAAPDCNNPPTGASTGSVNRKMAPTSAASCQMRPP
jgi:hypothetical protein